MDLQIFGNQNCSRCEQVKNVLQSKNIDFTYTDMEELSTEDYDNVMNKAREKHLLSLPVMVLEGEALKLQEVLERCS